MTRSINSTDDRSYAPGYEARDVTPLRQYFEEVFGHIRGLEAIGVRGDRNYVWYSKDGVGAAYYRIDEQRLAAESTATMLADAAKRKTYVSGIKAVSAQVRAVCRKAKRLEAAGWAALETEEVLDFALSLWQLDTYLSTFYQVGQPYRLQLFTGEQGDEAAEFLTELERLRADMVTRGFEPLRQHMDNVTDELARRLGYEDGETLAFLTHDEFEQLADSDEAIVPLPELQRRRGQHDEYMIRINEGEIEYYYGAEAGRQVSSLTS